MPHLPVHFLYCQPGAEDLQISWRLQWWPRYPMPYGITRPQSVKCNFHSCFLLSSCQIIVDDDGERPWSLYDAGPKSVRCPIMFLPPASGRADVFFKQILGLSATGYRVIGVSVVTAEELTRGVVFALLQDLCVKWYILLLGQISFAYASSISYTNLWVRRPFQKHLWALKSKSS